MRKTMGAIFCVPVLVIKGTHKCHLLGNDELDLLTYIKVAFT